MSAVDTGRDAVERLRQLAKAATRGRWEAIGNSVYADGKPILTMDRRPAPNEVEEAYHHRDSAFIAAAHPDLVLALLAERDAALAAVREEERERIPLSQRPGFSSDANPNHPLTRELSELVRRQRLAGAVLLSFTSQRVGVNSSSPSDEFGTVMELIADLILESLDDGSFEDALATAIRQRGEGGGA